MNSFLPGFGPDEDPLEILGTLEEKMSPPAPESMPVSPSKLTETIEVSRAWPELTTEIFTDLRSVSQKFDANIAAIERLTRVTSETLSIEDRTCLSRYTGWGGIPQAFDLEHAEWGARARVLKDLLCVADYESAKGSTPNAHFTDLSVVQAMWRMVCRLGFTGGKVLEPAAGVGYFLGAMPRELVEKSRVTAIELDRISARILSALYAPYGVNVINDGFEKVFLPENSFDLVISNVPFGNYQVHDPRHPVYGNFTIHNYFFARALEVLKPGGLAVLITSRYLLDGKSRKVRDYLASVADLVSAWRLPNTAFKAIANTQVTTDILVLKKKDGTSVDYGPWRDTVQVSTDPEDNPLYINEWFYGRPNALLGQLKSQNTAYGVTLECVDDGTFEKCIDDLESSVPEGVFSADTSAQNEGNELVVLEKPLCGYYLIEDRLGFADGSFWEACKKPKKTEARIREMIELRDVLKDLLHKQAQPGMDDEGCAHLRDKLNRLYDRFVKAYGHLNDRANRIAFRDDPAAIFLLALEDVDEDEGTISKCDLFTRNTVRMPEPVDSCETINDALMVCLAQEGRVNIERIAGLLGKSHLETVAEIESEGIAFKDPETGAWLPRDEYLSGDVKTKLEKARDAGPGFERNVKALEAVIPEDLKPGEIEPRLGASWIAPEIVEQFVREVLCDNDDYLRYQNGPLVQYSEVAGTWGVNFPYSLAHSHKCRNVFGTKRANAGTLLKQSLNQQVPTIYDTVDERRILNAVDTAEAREKQYQLKQAFAEWVWADAARAETLARKYNDMFNRSVERIFDGSHLTLPGLSEAITLRKHQKDAVWRTLVSGNNTLLAHVVGAGKTLVMICAGMEAKRIGKINLPMYCVPNHMLEQFSREFLEAYPSARLLVADKQRMHKTNRQRFLAQVAMQEWDAIIITHSSFERIALSLPYMEDRIKEELDRIVDAIQNENGNDLSLKELQKQKRHWEARLESMQARYKKDSVISFEALGVDMLFVDEAHLFKNLWRFTKMDRIAGLPNSNSQRAFDMVAKTDYIRKWHGGSWGVVFATATPIANTVAELWVMQRYLMPDRLAELGMNMFDAWAGTFGESVTAMELAPDGSGYRMKTRFSRFVNVPELMALFREVADIKLQEDLGLPVPEAQHETVVAPKSEILTEIVKSLVERSEKIRQGEVTPDEDNMLLIAHHGRCAALDVRLYDDYLPEPEDSKLALIAGNVLSIYRDSREDRSTQMVFMDLGTPGGSSFCCYDALKEKLVAGGIPEQEVAYIHDAKTDQAKAKMFKAMREGKIAVLIGSTSKMGVGTNVQTRLLAMHLADPPWRPADVEQRIGRIVRQGNQNEKVFIYTYITEGSFDAYIWQTLETKQKFIKQVMQGNKGIRTIEDIDETSMSYAQIKAIASGNPLVMEKAEVDAEIGRLSLLRMGWENARFSARRDVAMLPDKIQEIEEIVIPRIEADLAKARACPEPAFRYGALKLSNPKEITAALRAIARKATQSVVKAGEFGPFTLEIERSGTKGDPIKYLVLRGERGYQITKASATLHEGWGNALFARYQRLDEALEKAHQDKEMLESNLESARKSIDQPFEHEEALAALQKRQRELEQALDLDKGDMAAADAA